MVSIITPLIKLKKDDVFLADNGKSTFRVIINTGDYILIEMLIDEQKFIWWNIKDEGNITIQVIQSK